MFKVIGLVLRAPTIVDHRLGVLVALYLLGFLSGLVCVAGVVFWAFGLRWNFTGSLTAPSTGIHRLARYLHESQHLSGTRRR